MRILKKTGINLEQLTDRSLRSLMPRQRLSPASKRCPFLKFCQTPWRALAVLFLAVNTSVALAGSAVYTYDSLGRLSKVTYSNGVVVTYTYDAAGNRISQTVTGAT